MISRLPVIKFSSLKELADIRLSACPFMFIPLVDELSKYAFNYKARRPKERRADLLIRHRCAVAQTSGTADTYEASCSWSIAPCTRNQARRNQ